MTDIQTDLFKLQDIKYRDFQGSLIPNIEKRLIIGVRTPRLREMANDICKCGDAESFIESLPHYYFEENQLHAFIIERESNFDRCIALVKRFLPYIDNWATCDQLSPKCFAKHPEKLLPYIENWLASKHTYSVRFAVLCLMRYFLDDLFEMKYAQAVSDIKSEEYYIKTAVAWYFATALAKQYDAVLPFITEKKLDKWTHNKAIQKSRESFMVTKEHKQLLNSLKY